MHDGEDLPPLLAYRPRDFKGKPILPVAGSVRVPCSGCGTDILVQPASKRMLDEGKARGICPPCFTKECEDDIFFIQLPPGAAEELKEHLRTYKERN